MTYVEFVNLLGFPEGQRLLREREYPCVLRAALSTTQTHTLYNISDSKYITNRKIVKNNLGNPHG